MADPDIFQYGDGLVSVILLAATLEDGHSQMREKPYLVGMVAAIVTPRTAHRAHGMTVDHIFRTPAFGLLPHHKRNPAEFHSQPAVATSWCETCKDGRFPLALVDGPETTDYRRASASVPTTDGSKS